MPDSIGWLSRRHTSLYNNVGNLRLAILKHKTFKSPINGHLMRCNKNSIMKNSKCQKCIHSSACATSLQVLCPNVFSDSLLNFWKIKKVRTKGNCQHCCWIINSSWALDKAFCILAISYSYISFYFHTSKQNLDNRYDFCLWAKCRKIYLFLLFKKEFGDLNGA